MSIDLPPKSKPVLIKQSNGRILSGIVVEIDYKSSVMRLSRVSVLEIVGLKSKLDSIYGKKGKINGIFEIPIETVVHWENLPDYLRLED